MKWSEVRTLYPNQFVKFIIVQSNMNNNVETINEVALWGPIPEREAKYQIFRAPHPWIVMHTGRETLELHHRGTYKRLPSDVPKYRAEQTISYMPNDVSWDEIIYKLYVMGEIELGLQSNHEEEPIPHEEVMDKIRERIHHNLMSSEGETVFTQPRSAGDPRPQDKPMFVEPICRACHSTLVLLDAFQDGRKPIDKVWHDEFICPVCQDDIHLDVPEPEQN